MAHQDRLGTDEAAELFFLTSQIGTETPNSSKQSTLIRALLVFCQSLLVAVFRFLRGDSLGGGNPARATALTSESERQNDRQSSGQLTSGDA